MSSYLPHGHPDGLADPALDDRDTSAWWEACRRHELLVQRCTTCRKVRFPPNPLCPFCHSFEWAWEQHGGHGTVWSYAIVTHPVHPGVVSRVPYNVVLVELDEANGERMVGNILDAAPEEVWIGMRVELVWEDIEDRFTLPQWRKASAT